MPTWLKWTTIAVALAAGAALLAANAAGLFASAPVFSTTNGAIDGYDPVAFHLDGKPTPGDPAITRTWRGATWRFASAANRQRFDADPERYAPAYGGYCAYAMAGDYTANGDPLAFTVHGGRLFLNFDTDTRAAWLAERDARIEASDRNWPGSRPAKSLATLDPDS